METFLVEDFAGAVVPGIGSYPSQSLTLVLLASGYHGFPEDLRAHYPSALASQMIPDIRRGDTMSVLQPDLIVGLKYWRRPDTKAESVQISGTVAFAIPGKWSGEYGFDAEKSREGAWRITEFRLPGTRRRIVRQQDGTWRVVMGLERAEQHMSGLGFDAYPTDGAVPGVLARRFDPLAVGAPVKYAEALAGKAKPDRGKYPQLVGRLPGTFCEKDYFQVVQYRMLGHRIEAVVRHVQHRGADMGASGRKSVYLLGSLPALLPGRYSVVIEFIPWVYPGDKRLARPWTKSDSPQFVERLKCEFEMPGPGG